MGGPPGHWPSMYRRPPHISEERWNNNWDRENTGRYWYEKDASHCIFHGTYGWKLEAFGKDSYLKQLCYSTAVGQGEDHPPTDGWKLSGYSPETLEESRGEYQCRDPAVPTFRV